MLNVCNDLFFRVGGGISNNDFVLEIMSSLTCQTIDRPSQTDMSTLGAAFLAGLAAGMILMLCSHYSGKIYVLTQNVMRYSMNTYPICLHFGDRCVAASFRAEITVLMCEQKPYPVWFSRRRKSYPIVEYEHLSDM